MDDSNHESNSSSKHTSSASSSTKSTIAFVIKAIVSLLWIAGFLYLIGLIASVFSGDIAQRLIDFYPFIN